MAVPALVLWPGIHEWRWISLRVCVCSCSFLNSCPFPQGNDNWGVLEPDCQEQANNRRLQKNSVCWCEGRINSSNPETSARVKGKLRYERGCSADFWGEHGDGGESGLSNGVLVLLLLLPREELWLRAQVWTHTANIASIHAGVHVKSMGLE